MEVTDASKVELLSCQCNDSIHAGSAGLKVFGWGSIQKDPGETLGVGADPGLMSSYLTPEYTSSFLLLSVASLSQKFSLSLRCLLPVSGRMNGMKVMHTACRRAVGVPTSS